MKPKEFLKLRGITAVEFAAEIQFSVATVSRVFNGKADPSALFVRRSYAVSGGAITQADLIPVNVDSVLAELAANRDQPDA